MADNNNEGAKISFIDGVKAEFKNISWPDGKSLSRQTTAVIIISVIAGILIAAMDFVFQHGFNFISNIQL